MENKFSFVAGFLFLVVLSGLSFVSSATIAQTFSCQNGYLPGCVNMWISPEADGSPSYNCGLARQVYFGNAAGFYKTTSLNIAVPKTANYSCTIGITTTGFGYNPSDPTAPQTSEKDNVYLNNIFIDDTQDTKCNSGTSCHSCDQVGSTLTKTLVLNQGSTVLRLDSLQSHGINSVSINCEEVVQCVASNEVCDGIDNDCDGQIDESLSRSTNQNGICSTNTQTCSAGTWVNSTNNINPSVESCNNLDDNCNGQIDEGIPSIFTGTETGECRQEIRSCVAGVFQITQTGINSSSETCDNKDNNCNGQIDENLFRNMSNQLGRCAGNMESCNVGLWWEVIRSNYYPQAETCNNLDDNCNGQIDEGLNCGFVCADGNVRNSISTNFCSGLNVLTNSSYERCSSNSWQYLFNNNVFNKSCSGATVLENQFCSGNNLVMNWSMPNCNGGNCGRDYFTNQTVCANGCANNQCTSVRDYPACSIDYLKEYNSNKVYNFSTGFINKSGNLFVYGSASSNSNEFIMRYVGYNRTSPDYSYYSWRASDNQDLWNIWRTDQNDVSFTEGNHTICCVAESQRCAGTDNCEVRVGNATCQSFCIDTRAPIINILEFTNMSNWNSTEFNWSFVVSDLGCAGLDHYNVSVNGSNGFVSNFNDYSFTSLYSTNLTNHVSYTLTVTAIDNAGNVLADSSILYVNLSLPNNGTNGNNTNNTNQTNNETDEEDRDDSGSCNNCGGSRNNKKNIDYGSIILGEDSINLNYGLSNSSVDNFLLLDNQDSKFYLADLPIVWLALVLLILILLVALIILKILK